MNIYILGKKEDLKEEQISLLKENGKVIFIEEKQNVLKHPYIDDKEEKILAIDPDLTDWEFSNDIIEKIPNLRAICLQTTSFDWVDGEFCRGKNIKLTNVPHYSTNAVAECASFLMLSLARKLPIQLKTSSTEGMVYSSDIMGLEVKGKTMGIIGLGTIGSKVAEKGKGLGMNVVYWSRNKKEADYEYMPIDKLLVESDFIFLTLAKNDETKNFVTKEMLSNMKTKACFITIATEGIEDREYLIKQTEAGNIGGLAFESEKDRMTNYKGNIMITKPYAWYTGEALDNMFEIWTETIIATCKNESINVVNN
ncbi:MAG TPA: hypothetical protein DEG71_07820 [Clostridiales bacterium]|nr:hypothetical protein [Clostridiales bacterium]